LQIYVLNDNESYFEVDGLEVITTDTNDVPIATNLVDYVGLSETAWSSGGGTNQNILSTNLCHGPFFSVTNAGWDTHLTLISTGRTTPGTPGGTDDRDSVLGDAVGAFPVPITELDAFKAALSNDTNGEITLLLVAALGADTPRLEVASLYDGVRPVPALTVLSGADNTPPTAVTNLTVASAVAGVVNLSWSGYILDADMQGFNVYRSTTSGSYGAPLATISNIWATSYQDATAASDGTTYYYKVNTFDEVPNESEGNEVDATPGVDSTPPSVPANLVATAGDGSVVLNWDDSTDGQSSVAYYNVYRSTTSESGFAVLTNVALSAYLDNAASNGTTYYYKVSAVDSSPSANESALSAQVEATPEEVTGAQLTTFGTGADGYGGFIPSAEQLDQTWTNMADGVQMHSQNTGTLNTSLLKEFVLDRGFGAQYTIEGVVEMVDGYADDNNRLGFYLFGDDSDLSDGATVGTNTVSGEDEVGAMGLIFNTDDSSTGGSPGNNAQDNLTIREGIDTSTFYGNQLRNQVPTAYAQDLFGTEVKFSADITFTNIGGTNVIVVSASMATDVGVSVTTIPTFTLEAAQFTGDYFGFVNRARSRNYDGDPDPTGASRDNPWIMKYKSFTLTKLKDGAGGPVLTDFEQYLVDSGLASDAGATTDSDGDGLANLYEYGIGGNPNNIGDTGTAPAFAKDGSAFIYVYPRRSDTAILTYTVETSTNLLDSLAWTAAGTTEIGDDGGSPLEMVTNSVTTVEDEKFVRLKIEQ
jgi:fibronectin type 3 domain-containing protein